jgi:hypothetical protein
LRLRKPTPDDCVERRTLNWLKRLDQLGADAMRGGEPELAARIYMALFQLSSVNRRPIDVSAQVTMQSPPDLSGLSEAELKTIELGSDAQLDALALRIGRLKSAELPDADD